MKEALSPGMARRTRVIHFVGIGGIGMSGIAELLLNLGYQVRGSDLKTSDTTRRLAELGGDVRIGHTGENVVGVDVVVISSAVRADNPEVVAARGARIPVIRRAEMLAELMRLKFGIAIGGSHGKTTTTSLVASILSQAGLDPTVVVGGKVNKLGSNARLGHGSYLVAEADESDGSFLHLTPSIAVVTNIDPEHLDFYRGGLEEIRRAFANFVNRIPFYGLAVLCGDHPVVQAMLPEVERRYVTYGLSPQAQISAKQIVFSGPETRFQVWVQDQLRGELRLPMLGQHNVLNALAAVGVAEELGVPFEATQAALASFDGVDRRFTVRGAAGGVTVVDDYGHHPEEIRVTLDGARRAYPDRRLLVGFQPHRYSRTQELMDDFAGAFHQAEVVVLAPIYAAGEDPRPGVSSEALLARMKATGHRHAELAEGVEGVAERLLALAQPGDLVITFGAGDIGRAGRLVLAGLENRPA